MVLYVVVPCYNEEEVLPETASRLRSKMNSLIESGTISGESRILFVNDGSKDGTWNIVRKLHGEDSLFQGLSLSRNRGHQNALFAGLMTARDKCDACISMDADLQDDIDAMDEMIEQYKDGCDVVYGVRKHRDTDSFFKRSTAIFFYRMMKRFFVYFSNRISEGLEPLNNITADFSTDEQSVLYRILHQNGSVAPTPRSLREYIEVIERESRRPSDKKSMSSEQISSYFDRIRRDKE